MKLLLTAMFLIFGQGTFLLASANPSQQTVFSPMVFWSQDGQSLVISPDGKTVCHYAVATFSLTHQLELAEFAIGQGAVWHSATMQLIVGDADSGSIHALTFTDDAPTSLDTGLIGPVQILALSPDERLLAVNSPTSTTIQLWDWTNAALWQVIDFNQNITRAEFSSDGQFIAFYGGVDVIRYQEVAVIWVWDIRQNKLVHTLTVVDENLLFIPDIAFMADDSFILALNKPRSILYWHLPTGTSGMLPMGVDGVAAMAFNPDGNMLAISMLGLMTSSIDVTAHVLTLKPSNFNDEVVPDALSFDPTGRYLAIFDESSWQIWHTNTGEKFGALAPSVSLQCNRKD